MLVFLSHSGSDTDAARALKERIAGAPAAREAGLEIWLDVDELRPGDEWQPALEEALERADAFMVYVGARGVVNWVDRELRHALTRATGPGAIPFVPVLANAALEPSILPPFVRQFQAVTDPLGDDHALSALIAALLSAGTPQVALTDRPFVGLTAMGEAEADRFFGRDAEIAELSDLIRRHALVAVVADSGAGKSSLVRAGLVPAFRGGALLPDTEFTHPVPRHVVTMRPGADPVQGLKDGVDRAARALGRDAATRRALRQSVRADDPGETYYALACDIDHEAPDILLVIDQFEELLTATPPDIADTFARLVLGLVDSDRRRVRVVLTVRVDYFNLIRRHEALFARLEAEDGAAQLRLKRVSDEGLDEIVKRPLIMAGHTDAAERDALAAAIRRDITGRPGDLALVQMALYATWRRAVETGDDLMTAYTQAGGVHGALAHQAEETRQRLSEAERAALLPLFARLVRLGDTGGATRRFATLSELGPERAALARKLATEEAGRLLMVGDDSAEIAHEALVAQWPWLQEQIQAGAGDIRTLAWLGDRTVAWKQSGAGALPNDVERAAFAGLAARHGDWLSEDERACLAAARRRATLRRATGIAALVTVLAFGVAMTVLAWRLSVAEEELQASLVTVMQAKRDADKAAQTADMEAQRATAALAEAARNAAGGLVALSIIAANSDQWQDAIKLALAAWPRKEGGFGVQLADPIDTLSRALPAMRAPREAAWPTGAVKAEFSPDGRYNVYQPEPTAPFELRRTNTGAAVLSDQTYPRGSRLAFSADGRFFSASSQSGHLWLVDLRTEKKTRIEISSQYVTAVAFSPDGETLYAAFPNGPIYMYRTADPARPFARLPVGADSAVWTLAASPDGEHLALGRREGALEIWNLEERSMVARASVDTDNVDALRFSENGQMLVVFEPLSASTMAYRILEAESLKPIFFGSLELGLVGANRGEVGSDTAMGLSGSLIHVPGPDGVLEYEADLDDASRAIPAGYKRVLTDQFSKGPSEVPEITCVELSPDRRQIAVADRFGRVDIRSAETGVLMSEYHMSVGPILDMVFLSDSSVAVIDALARVRVIDFSERPDVSWWTPPGRRADRVELSQDWTRMAMQAGDTPVQVREIPTGQLVAELADVSANAQIFLSPDGTRIAANSFKTLRLYGLSNAPEVPAPRDIEITGSGSVDLVAFSDDGRIVAIAGGARAAGYVDAYDTETGSELLKATYRRTGTSPDIRFAGNDAALRVQTGLRDEEIWFALDGSNAELETAPELPDVNPVRDFLRNIASGHSGSEQGVLTPDKTRLAVLNDGKVDIFDTATGTVIAQLSDRQARLIAIQFPEPATLHAVTDDGRIGTWNLSDIAEGTAFDLACGMLGDADLEEALRGYPIVQNDPICGPDYDPPIPDWMEAAHAAIGYRR